MALIFRRTACLFTASMILACSPTLQAASNTDVSKAIPDEAMPQFAQIVLAHFDQWDLNHDGTISGREIDSAIVSPSAVGNAAAAMITVRRAIHPRTFDPKMPPITRDVFADWDDHSPVGKTLNDSFSHALKQVRSRPAGLFPNTDAASGANLHCMHQGQVGDCFFIAPTGAFTMRDPSAVKKMIEPLPNGAGYRVTFGNGQTTTVPPITDAEYAIGASTSGEGLWLPVLEQAYGRLKMATLPADKQTDFFTDALTRGGMSKNVIALYTGHTSHAIVLRSVKHKVAATRPNEDGNDQANHSADLDAAENNRADLAMPGEATVDKFRAAMKDAIATHHLITAGGLARQEDMPPDLSANHVYAIVGYDAEHDIVQVWNPHGQDYTPKGPDGLRYGFTTKHGRFDVPVKEFVQVFRSATFETDAPATQPAIAKATDAVTVRD